MTWDALPPTDLIPNPATWATQSGEDGAVERAYDNLLDTTEIRTKLTPRIEGTGDNPTTLYLSAVFKGRTLKTTPDRVWLRAHSNLQVQSSRLRTPTLSLTADGKMLLHVVDPPAGAAAWLNYPCPRAKDPCAFDGIVVAIPIVSFFQLLAAHRVFGEALGVPFGLTEVHLRRLSGFARALVPAPD